MEPTRELDQIRSELNTLHDRTTSLRVEIAASQAATEQRFAQIMACLEELRKDIESTNTSITNLQQLASEGKTSLKTLLWLGGAVAAVTTFVLMIYSYIPR